MKQSRPISAPRKGQPNAATGMFHDAIMQQTSNAVTRESLYRFLAAAGVAELDAALREAKSLRIRRSLKGAIMQQTPPSHCRA